MSTSSSAIKQLLITPFGRYKAVPKSLLSTILARDVPLIRALPKRRKCIKCFSYRKSGEKTISCELRNISRQKRSSSHRYCDDFSLGPNVSRIVIKSFSELNGLVRNPSILRFSSWEVCWGFIRPLIAIILVPGLIVRRALIIAGPSIRGIEISVSTSEISSFFWANNAIPSAPSVAVIDR